MIGGLASSIAGGVKARQAADAARAEYNQKQSMLDNWFNKQYYSDITQRTDVQNMLRILDENQTKQAKRDEALAAITGATTESQLAAQESRNKSYADALAEIASNASTLKDTYLQNYMAQKMGMTNPESGILANQANQWSQAGSNLFQSGASLLGSGLDGLNIGGGGGAKSSSPTTPTYDPRLNTYKSNKLFYNSPT